MQVANGVKFILYAIFIIILFRFIFQPACGQHHAVVLVTCNTQKIAILEANLQNAFISDSLSPNEIKFYYAFMHTFTS